MPSKTAADYIAAKTPQPSELRTAESRAMGAWLHERAFVMASVTEAKILDANQKIIEKVLLGGLGRSEARNELRKFYKQNGYEPLAGLEGSIKDLSAPKRMDATIERNVQDAQGWERLQQYSGDITNPGLELYRAGHANQPRDWESRWQQHSGGLEDAVDNVMIALVSSPIWIRISAFGRPSPPFDWGSHMDIRPVSLERCIALGLISDPKSDDQDEAKKGKDALRGIKNQAAQSLNENWEDDCDLSDADLRAALEKSLGGLARLDGGVIRMTDPNGTRPYSAAEIGDVISAKLPNGLPNLQLAAFEKWADDPHVFDDGSDEKEDMARLIARIKPEDSRQHGALSRGLNFSSREGWDAFATQLEESGEYGAQEGTLAESWTKSPRAALDYASSAEDDYSVILRAGKYSQAKSIRGITADDVQFFAGNVRWNVVGKRAENKTLYLDVEEL